MGLRAAEIAIILAELEPRLGSARLNRSHQADPHRLILEVKAPQQPALTLLICTAPSLTRIHEIEKRPPNPIRPLAFQMLLRAHVDGDRIERFTQAVDDRIVTFYFAGGHRLVAELTGRHANVFLLDAHGEILGSLLPNTGDARSLHTGATWQPPTSAPPAPKPSRFQGEDVNTQVRTHYARAETEHAVESLKSRLGARLRKALKKARRRERAIASDRERAAQAETFRRWGEALKAALHRIQPKAERVTVVDYLDPETPEIEIELDPQLTPAQNMEAFFKKHRKLTQSIEHIERREKQTRDEIARLQTWLKRLEAAGDDLTALRELKSDLPRAWFRSRTPAQEPRADERSLPYRTFESATGHRILVGRDARRNDELTFRHARGNDVWMHVRDYPGSHVVIPLQRNQTADKETLLDAATLAIAHSRAPDGATVEVAYTQAKHVRKPKGAKPGLVTITGEKTLYLAAEQTRLERLRSTLSA